MNQIKCFKTMAAISLALMLGWGSVHANELSKEQQARLDTIELNLDDMESKVRSTLMFGGSSPVSFSGEARVKLQWHNFNVYPDYLRYDRSYLQSGWEGNENMVRVGMVARPGRNTVLWAKLGFQHTMQGNRHIYDADDLKKGDGFSQMQTRHDKMNTTVSIHEDMNAGIAIRTVPASFWVKLGNTHWTEASPLTIWKSQPRTFAWEYLPFEVEQPIARYYEYNIAKGEKTGRAAWNKKPFNGINIESVNLPANLYFNFLYAAFERFDNFEREYIDFANDIAYGGELNANIKSDGVGDSYRKIFHTRLAAKKFYNELTAGVNINIIDYNEDIVYANGANGRQFNDAFGIGDEINQTWEYTETVSENGDTAIDTVLISQGKGFLKEPRIVSFDIKGALNEKISIHTDFALGWIDTTWLISDSTNVAQKPRFPYTSPKTRPMGIKSKEVKRSGIKPAFYSNMKWNGKVPISADVAYISKGFYSPFSFATPVDAFYAFGSNLLGAGKFIARGEASPYSQNMAGILLAVEPKVTGYGHLRFKYGQHFQIESARDLLFFPYRLNGPDYYSMFQSTFTRWGNGEIDHIFTDSYKERLGDESFTYPQHHLGGSPSSGGIRTDFLATYEGFVAYQDSLSAALNMNASKTTVFDKTQTATVKRADGTVDTLEDENSFIPQHRKFTFNLEADIGYDIGPMVGYSKDFFLGGYASVSGVSTSFKPISFSDGSDDMLLWSIYLRFEPAIALTNKLYLIGLLGFENWRSQKAYTEEDGGVKHSPIDFRDAAYGIGMDWDVFERVGFHLRAKWMTHKDVNLEENNWSTPVISTEMKMWF